MVMSVLVYITHRVLSRFQEKHLKFFCIYTGLRKIQQKFNYFIKIQQKLLKITRTKNQKSVSYLTLLEIIKDCQK